MITSTEVRRLRKLEAHVKDLIVEKTVELSEKHSDLDMCSIEGWDEGYERIEREINVVLAERKILVKLLEAAQ